jgi:Rrf2 family protein
MRINTGTRYGVRALFDLAYFCNGGPAQIKEISSRQRLSPRYLEQIFNRLVKKGIVASRRGPRGGYILARDPSDITVADIVVAIQGPIAPVACLAEDELRSKRCALVPNCVTRHVWRETQRRLVQYFESVTLAKLCEMASAAGIGKEVKQAAAM